MKYWLNLLLIVSWCTGLNAQSSPCEKKYTGNFFIKRSDGTTKKVPSPMTGSQLLLYSWRYDFRPKPAKDSSPVLGTITFFRVAPVKENGRLWQPHISFDIMSVADSLWCMKELALLEENTSCEAPYIGGDIYNIGAYIFLNREPCLDCVYMAEGEDCCRYIMQLVFRNVWAKEKTPLSKIISRFPLQKGVYNAKK